MTENEKIAKIINETKTIAVIGLSPKPDRISYSVSDYLKRQGYRIIPVYPGESEILGEKAYGSVLEIKDTVDTVLIFRKPEEAFKAVQEAVKLGPKFIWMQKGVISKEALALAESSGIPAVMDRCIREEHLRLSGQPDEGY